MPLPSTRLAVCTGVLAVCFACVGLTISIIVLCSPPPPAAWETAEYIAQYPSNRLAQVQAGVGGMMFLFAWYMLLAVAAPHVLPRVLRLRPNPRILRRPAKFFGIALACIALVFLVVAFDSLRLALKHEPGRTLAESSEFGHFGFLLSLGALLLSQLTGLLASPTLPIPQPPHSPPSPTPMP